MASTNDVLEARRAVIQTVAELDRGMQIIEIQLKTGKFMDARETAKKCRDLVKLQDQLFKKYLKEAR
jgi:valyl-tRNA synthetase